MFSKYPFAQCPDRDVKLSDPESIEIGQVQKAEGVQDKLARNKHALKCPNCFHPMITVKVSVSNRIKTTTAGVSSESVHAAADTGTKVAPKKNLQAEVAKSFKDADISFTEEDMLVLETLTKTPMKYLHPEKLFPSYRRWENNK